MNNVSLENPLYNYFINNQKNQIDKWMHYFDVYHNYFERYRNTSFVFVEVGIQNGGSLQMWRDYFGKDARIIGIDIDERCKVMEQEGFEIWIGDQADPCFWGEFRKSINKIDIFLDDGGHTMQQQLTTFKEMFPVISNQGYYVCEDIHSSYMEFFNGGYRKKETSIKFTKNLIMGYFNRGYNKKETFIEFAKNLIDDMHAFHSQNPEEFQKTAYTKTLTAMHIFDSIIVFEKGARNPPILKAVGNPLVVDNRIR